MKPLLRSNCSKFMFWQHFSMSYLNSHLDCTCERISSVITVIFLTLLRRLFDIEPTSITSVACSWWVRDCKTSKSELDFFVLWTSEESEVSSSTSCHNTWNVLILFNFPQDITSARSYCHFCRTNSCLVILYHHFSMTSDCVGVWVFPFQFL